MVHLLSPDEYQPGLRQRFSVVAERLSRLIPGGRIEHVGSSSVPGAESKGDLDICMVVDEPELEQVVRTLLAAGYREQQNTLRTEALCMLVWDGEDNEHAVQVVATGSTFMNFMVFRDLLCSHPSLLQAYNRAKRAASGCSEEEYRQRKAEFIEGVLRSHRGRG